MHGIVVICVVIFEMISIYVNGVDEVDEILRMPGIHPRYDDSYHCTWKKIEGAGFIVSFDPLVGNNASVAHHLLVYGCQKPLTVAKPVYECSTICQDGALEQPRILYAWARQAPPLHMPPRVGYPVGGATGIKYLVLQVHYKGRSLHGDHTGVRLHITTKPQPNLAGIYRMFAYYGVIPPGRERYSVDVSCRFNASVPIHPFAFRVHAHALGRSIAAYLIRGNSIQDGAVLLGKGNPQWPQAFYPIANDVLIRPGDFLFVRCVYDSLHRTMDTRIGGQQHNEMCNFFLMYYKAAPRFAGERRINGIECGGNSFRLKEKEGVRLWNLVPKSSLDLPPDLPPSSPAQAPPPTDEESSGPGLVMDDSWRPRGLNNIVLGQVSGIDVDSDGRLFVFHRAHRVWNTMSFNQYDIFTDGPIPSSPILILNASTGALLHHFGAGQFYMPHGLDVDLNGNLWLTDVGRHQVIKYDKDKWDQPSLVLGTKMVPGFDGDHFCKPTSTAVNQKGEIFVADGYCNSRVLKFDPKGQIVKELERGYDYMQIPHSLTLIPEQDLVCVADRDRARIGCLSQSSGEVKFLLSDSPAFGEALYAITYRSDTPGLIYGVTSGSESSARGGFTLDLLSREVTAVWGRGHIDTPHALTVDRDKAVFVGQIQGRRRLLRFSIPTAKSAAVPLAVKSAKSAGQSVQSSVKSAAEPTADPPHHSSPKRFTFWLGLVFVSAVVSFVTVYACVKCRRRQRLGPAARYGPVLRERKGFELLVNQEDDEDVTFERQVNGPSNSATKPSGQNSIPPSNHNSEQPA